MTAGPSSVCLRLFNAGASANFSFAEAPVWTIQVSGDHFRQVMAMAGIVLSLDQTKVLKFEESIDPV